MNLAHIQPALVGSARVAIAAAAAGAAGRDNGRCRRRPRVLHGRYEGVILLRKSRTKAGKNSLSILN